MIFRAQAKLLSKLMGIWKARTLSYHPQTNRQVEWAQQMGMIGNLGKDQKADWPKHLPELVHAYNSMRLAFTGYSLHYLMFRWWLCLPINFYFPIFMSTEKHQCLNHYVADLHEQLHDTFKEAQVHCTSEAERQRWYYDHKANAIHWNQVTWSWLKPMATKGGERWKTGGRRNHTKWNAEMPRASLLITWKTSRLDAHKCSTRINFFSLPP